jgi:hypothetical protein
MFALSETPTRPSEESERHIAFHNLSTPFCGVTMSCLTFVSTTRDRYITPCVLANGRASKLQHQHRHRHRHSHRHKPSNVFNMCWTELVRYSACGHHIRRTYPCPYQQDVYQAEPDYLSKCDMQVVPPTDEDENGLCEKCAAKGPEVVTIPPAVPSDIPSAIPSATPSMIASATPSTTPSAIPSASGVQDMITMAIETVLSWARNFLAADGQERVHWKDVFELEAAFPGVERDNEGSNVGSDTDATFYKTSDNSEAGASTPPTPQSPLQGRLVDYQARTLPTPQFPPSDHSTDYEQHLLDKLGYIAPVFEPSSPQDGSKASSRECIASSEYGREICVELDGWYVVATCLDISVEELHEMMMRVLENRETGDEGM